jgi:hypothetical protein
VRIQLKDLEPDILKQVIELENINILPVLDSVGVKMTPAEMHNQIYKMMDSFIVLDCSEKRVNGFILYKVKDSSMTINSFNVRKLNSYKILISLLEQAVHHLRELNIQLIKSKAHVTNKRSLCLHRNMGFQEVNKTTTEIEFLINKNALLSKIQYRLSRLTAESIKDFSF